MTVTTAAISALLKKSWMRPGESPLNAAFQPSSVIGSGMNVRRTASGEVLKEVTTVHRKGTNISNAQPMSRT